MNETEPFATAPGVSPQTPDIFATGSDHYSRRERAHDGDNRRMPPDRRLAPDDPRADLVRRLQAAWNRGDVDAVMAGHHPDAVYVMIGGLESLVGREFQGRDAIREFFEDFQASFGGLHIEVEQVIPAGERILVILNQHNRGEAGGVETFNRWAQLLFFSKGLIIRAENYYEVDKALEAIGAS